MAENQALAPHCAANKHETRWPPMSLNQPHDRMRCALNRGTTTPQGFRDIRLTGSTSQCGTPRYDLQRCQGSRLAKRQYKAPGRKPGAHNGRGDWWPTTLGYDKPLMTNAERNKLLERVA